jgi:four helix bundle protein
VSAIEGPRKGTESEYEDWEHGVHPRILKEAIWRFFGYRKSLYAYELAWRDCGILQADARGKAIAQQLIRSIGSIGANLEEGHGRGYGKQRDWFFRVAAGSARESKGWYWRAKFLLAPEVVDARLELLDEILALIVTELRRHSNH